MIRGRTTSTGGVEFYDASGTVVFTIDADTTAAVMASTAPTIADSTASDVAGMVTDFNALLAALRTRGVLAGS